MKALLIVILVILLLRLLIRIFLPVILKSYIEKFSRDFQQTNQQNQPPPPEGEVTIKAKKDKSKISGEDGEYVDYEEVK